MVEQNSRIVKILVRRTQCPEVPETGAFVRHPSAGHETGTSTDLLAHPSPAPCMCVLSGEEQVPNSSTGCYLLIHPVIVRG